MTHDSSTGLGSASTLADMVRPWRPCERLSVPGKRSRAELDPELVPIGQRIRAAREAAGISQTELAERIGVRAHTMWRYEAGRMRPGPDALVGIAKAVGVTPEYLLTGETALAESRIEYEVPESFRLWKEQIAPLQAPHLTPEVEARMLDTKFKYAPQDAPRWTIIYHEVLAEMRGREVASRRQASRELTEQAQKEAAEAGLMKAPPRRRKRG